MSALANVPGLAGYLEAQQQNEARSAGDLQKATMIQGLLAHMQQQAQAQKLKQALADSGGDAEKAAAAALKAGDWQAAAHLAPLAKQAQEQRMREETPRLLAQIQQPQAAGPQELGQGQPISQAGQPSTPQGPDQARQARIAQLTQMSLIPQVANNPVVVQRLQAEIDRLSTVRPMIEHQFSVGNDQVQPHISHDEGRTWQPVPGSQPSAKFARQVAPVGGGQEPMMPVKEPDGRIIYVPRSQAAGREVGGRVTDINLGKQVQQLGRDLQKADLPPTIAVLRRAEAVTPDLAQYVTGPMSMLPDRAIPQVARDARQDVQRLFNIVLKQRSGAAVTNQEMDRLKQEFGSGLIKTPSQLTTAIGRMREIIESHYTSIAGGYGKDALDTYNGNIEAVGGEPFQVRPRGGVGAPSQPGPPQAQQTGIPQVKDESEYNALPSGAVYIAPDGKTKRKR